ncbi:uncharacterized protein ARMOST_19976 [Armillaria ostoyae]|uniref:Uncharacterized protein n=1 Tax=Armillaria ostoyae TaxID=47428 RepID=A0A284S622_ARMOS|nr:uncharacterized protein ARMOST_19976 [Armillaria ostoyae]
MSSTKRIEQLQGVPTVTLQFAFMTRSRPGQFTFGIAADEIRRPTVQRNESGLSVVQEQRREISSSIAFLFLQQFMGHHHKILAYSPFDNDVYFKAEPRLAFTNLYHEQGVKSVAPAHKGEMKNK